MTSTLAAAGTVVAVTGASGYIGSHVCLNLVRHGYTVRACVRDKNNLQRTAHLLEMNNAQAGRLEICEADMMVEGSYDAIFEGCQAVFHVAGNFGTDRRWIDATNVPGRLMPVDEAMGKTPDSGETKSYDQGVYDSYVLPMKYILDSVLKSKTVKKLVYTSSGCAGPLVSNKDIGDEYSIQENAYGKGKVDCERLIYNFGEKTGIVCCSSCPTHVLGPILAAPLHDMTYQHRLGEMFGGKYCLDMDWNVCDVRDVAETQRLMLESDKVRNGSRYLNGAPGEEDLSPEDMIELLRKQFPNHASQIANAPNNKSDNSSGGSESSSSNGGSSSSLESSDNQSVCWASHGRTRWSNPEKDLGLRRHSVADTVQDTIASMLKFHMINREDIPTDELRNFYQVAEMDGCEEEMEYILLQLRSREMTSEK